MGSLKHLNKYFWKYRIRFGVGMLFVLISNYFMVLQPKVIRQAIDLVLDQLTLYRAFSGFELQESFMSQISATLMFFGLLVIVFAVLQGVFMYFMRQTIIVMSRLIEYDLRNEIYAHYGELSTAFYRRNKTGDLMARITEDVSRVRMYLGPAVMYAINLVGLAALVLWSMTQVSLSLTAYVLAPLPFLAFSIYYISNQINKKSERLQAQLSQINSVAQETYSGIRVVKSYVQEKSMTRFFDEECEQYKTRSLDLAKIQAIFYPVMLLMIGSSTILTIYVGGLQVIEGRISAGNIAEFVIYVGMLTWPVTSIGWVASLIQRAAASQKRINEFLQTKPDILSPDESVYPVKGDIRFENVSFVYDESGTRALSNISFELPAGSKLAIIGRTGSGKTSLAELLFRLYDATEGNIYIDGKVIREHSLTALRSNMGYVPQDVFLFSDTIGGNVAFGNNEASVEEIMKYMDRASIRNEIEELPKGIDTLVGERGVTLSGGQKQRISIARALIRKPSILFLDDCLSAVDTETESRVLRFLMEQNGSQTLIMITHRLKSMPAFDKIIVLDEGRIVQMGTHQELVRQEGYYREQYEHQLEDVQGT